MLANDSTETLKASSFFLIVYADKPAPALMSECGSCGSINSYCLELVWQLRTVRCSECRYVMRMSESDLVDLRDHLFQARLRVERLMPMKTSEGVWYLPEI